MKISIITVCKNNEDSIEETMKSVFSQNYPDIEYIIIDGFSTDNTVSIINKYKDKLAFFSSEKDSGMYEAMNKGIKASTGDAIYFLNAGDKLFHSSIMGNAIKHFTDNVDFLYGDVIEINKETGHCSIKRQNRVNKAYLYTNAICQQSILYGKSAFKKCGCFNTEYKIVGDREWLFRALLKEKITSKYIDIPFALFTKGGVSNNEIYEKIHSEERKKAKNFYFNPFIVSLTACIPKTLKNIIIKTLRIY